MKKEKMKKYLMVVLAIILLGLAVGYAAFSDVLTISGTATATGSFDVQFDSVTVDDRVGVNVSNTTATISADKNTLNIQVADMAYPGAGAQFTTTIKNVGTVPAKIDSITPTNLDTTNIEVVGLDVINTSHATLGPDDTCTVTFYVKWKESQATDLTNETVNFSLVINYVQDVTMGNFTNSHADNITI